MSAQEAGSGGKTWTPLSPKERRVLGVLVEKAKTTPEYYPMTLAGAATACNQKTNRHPITNYDQDLVEEILHDLRLKGATILVEAGGRAPKWKHMLYEWLQVSKNELAVIAELLLRGPQTEGDLRGRANRMCERDPIADIPALQAMLASLIERKLVQYLTPQGQKRGAIVAHALYPADENEKVRAEWAGYEGESDEVSRSAPGAAAPAARASAPSSSSISMAAYQDLKSTMENLRDESDAQRVTVAELKLELQNLRSEMQSLKNELAALKRDLGA